MKITKEQISGYFIELIKNLKHRKGNNIMNDIWYLPENNIVYFEVKRGCSDRVWLNPDKIWKVFKDNSYNENKTIEIITPLIKKYLNSKFESIGNSIGTADSEYWEKL